MSRTSPLQTTTLARRRRDDRRRGAGLALGARADAKLGRGERRMPLWIVNISQQGVGLLSTERVRIGTQVEVHPHASRKDCLHATVLHCTSQAEGEWYLGCLLADGITVDLAMLSAGKAKRPD